MKLSCDHTFLVCMLRFHVLWLALIQSLRVKLMGRFSVLLMVIPVICLITGEYFVLIGTAQLVDCLESDREALVNFKNGLEDPENRLSSWKGGECCQWQGIACDNSTGAVITVDLHNPSGRYGSLKLTGEIRPSITKLKSLRHLDLSSNTFDGLPIPDFLASLENLQYLNLSNAGFTGAIPSNLGNLSSLQYLDVSSDFLGLTVDNLDWVTGLVSLKYLAMTGANLSMVGSDWLGELNKLSFLIELHLASCSLHGSIPSLSSVNFSSLAVIDFSGNKFSSKVPNWLMNISSLVSVDISSNGLYGRIPLGFSELPKLEVLDLSNNYNITASCSQLFRGSWAEIKVLNFALNKLHGKLPYSLGNMTSLTYLGLLANDVEGGIPSSIGKLCNLKSFDLSGNNLTGSLPESLEGTENCLLKSPLPNLQNLLLSDNHMVGNLPSWLGQLRNLVELNLQYNLIQGPIPDSLGTLRRLTELRLAANELNGTLPYSIGQLSELWALDVSINHLTGVVSEGHFSMLSKLKILFLSANSFILKVSSSWLPPFQVQYLDMGSCHLGPRFPAWLKSQKELNFLDFSNASISDSIPNWFWDISPNLSGVLNVSLNQLQGQLPNPLNVAPSADINLSSNLFEGPVPLPIAASNVFDLSNNQFSGLIPKEIGKAMSKSIFLSISGNQLVGEIPDSIGEMVFLEVLDLSKNNLTGSIPSSIGNCLHLEVLDLQNNNLSGVIPQSLGQLNFLQTMHLGNNKISGELPSSFRNLSSLETLYLRNNRLTGKLPPWLGDGFKSLRILSLRSNAFSGDLLIALSNLSSLQILDLAENELNGTIPVSFSNFRGMAQEQKINRYLFYGMNHGLYYQESFVVNIKNSPQIYTKTLSLVTSIDLSGNHLYGEIPEEITKLVGLVVLNLSRNNISGQIPTSISDMRQLLSLDLSSNLLSGPIPPSMSSLTFLGVLNLSNNNLSGKVPYMEHMTTFDASSFAGNPSLCGDPLVAKCPGDDSDNGGTLVEHSDSGNHVIDKWFYLSLGLGFAAGILVPFIILAIRRPWSNFYFGFVDKTVDRLLYLGYKTVVRCRNYCNQHQ